jgi:hypothetical protein
MEIGLGLHNETVSIISLLTFDRTGKDWEIERKKKADDDRVYSISLNRLERN